MTTLSAYLQAWWVKLSYAKTVTAASHPHNREAKQELKVNNNGKSLTFYLVPTYFGVKLDRALAYRHHLEALRKKLSTCISLLRPFAGSEWGAGAKTLCIAAFSLIFSTADYCAPVWCGSAHTRLIHGVLNDALRIITGCLRPTSTDNLPSFSGIQPAELRRQKATLSLANRISLDLGHIRHGQLTESQTASRERLKSKHPFVPVVRKLLHYLSDLGIRAAQWTNLTGDTEYSKSTSALCVYILRMNSRPVGLSLTRTAWVNLNYLCTSVGRLCSSMHKWSLASSAKCECGANEKTADHII